MGGKKIQHEDDDDDVLCDRWPGVGTTRKNEEYECVREISMRGGYRE